MKPYYEDSQITIYHGDARDILPELQGDMILADPPYGETNLEWDQWPEGWLSIAARALLPHGSLWCFGSFRSFMTHRDEFAVWRLAQEIIWEKHNGSGFHADRFKRVHEIVAQFYPAYRQWSEIYKSPVYTNDATRRTVRRKRRPAHMGEIGQSVYVSHDGGPRLMRSVIRVRSTHGRAIHPTEKPIGILIPLIEYSCPPDGLVIDPFMGSGSALTAAKLLGRRAIGIEMNPTYIERAIERLAQHVLPLE